MKNKLWLFAVLLVMVGIVAGGGCSQGPSGSSAYEDTRLQEIGYAGVYINQPKEDVISLLGQPDSDSYDQYIYNKLAMIINIEGDASKTLYGKVSSIYVGSANENTLPEDIRRTNTGNIPLGSSRALIESTYGEPDDIYYSYSQGEAIKIDYGYSYKDSSFSLTFDKNTGNLFYLSIVYNPNNPFYGKKRLSSIGISPSSVNLCIAASGYGIQGQFSILGSYTILGVEAKAIRPQWSVINNVGNIDQDGFFTATNVGTGKVMATVEGYTAEAIVNVLAVGTVQGQVTYSANYFNGFRTGEKKIKIKNISYRPRTYNYYEREVSVEADGTYRADNIPVGMNEIRFKDDYPTSYGGEPYYLSDPLIAAVEVKSGEVAHANFTVSRRVELSNISAYLGATGYNVSGDITNNGDKAIENIRITYAFYLDEEPWYKTFSANINGINIPPHLSSGFNIQTDLLNYRSCLPRIVYDIEGTSYSQD